MSIYLEQAKKILESIDIPEIKQVQEEFVSLTKKSAISDLIHDPKFQNIVNILTPYVVNYKVNQVLKLLKEIEKEQRVIDPRTGLRRFV